MRRVFILSFIVILAGCNNFDSSSNSTEEYSDVLENVWTYVQSTEMPQSEKWKNAWLDGKVEEIEWSGEIANNQSFAENYRNETVLLVTPSFNTEPVAYPRIVVDPDTKEVIGELPGE